MSGIRGNSKNMKQSLRFLALFAGASLALAGSRVAPDMPNSSSVDVIVQFTNPPTKSELQALGSYGQLKKVFNNVTAGEVVLSPSQIPTLLANDPNIAYISPNRPNKGSRSEERRVGKECRSRRSQYH